ncbi:MAG TPA: GspH/FimT family pseudopilin [Steroidobacteraceae bacterium]
MIPQRQLGVTLVELMIVIAIATILMAIGVPSYRYVTKSNRVSGEINALLGDLTFARYEAVKEGLPVEVCPAAATATTCTASTTWSSGWIVLSNAAATGGTAVVLRRQLPFSNFNSTDTLTTVTAQSVTFNREGFATAGAIVNFSLHDATDTSSYTRCLVVNVAGELATGLSGQTILTATCT